MANESCSLKVQSCSLEKSEPWKNAHKYSVTENYPLPQKQKYFWCETNIIIPNKDQTRNIFRIWRFPWILQGSGKPRSCSVVIYKNSCRNNESVTGKMWKWSASDEAFGSQQNSVWFPRACLSSSCQYCEHNNKFNQTHWQQLYCTIPGDKANYNILFNERLWSPWNALR